MKNLKAWSWFSLLISLKRRTISILVYVGASNPCPLAVYHWTRSMVNILYIHTTFCVTANVPSHKRLLETNSSVLTGNFVYILQWHLYWSGSCDLFSLVKGRLCFRGYDIFCLKMWTLVNALNWKATHHNQTAVQHVLTPKWLNRSIANDDIQYVTVGKYQRQPYWTFIVTWLRLWNGYSLVRFRQKKATWLGEDHCLG